MQFSEEWKSHWAVSSVVKAPLLLSGPSAKPLGPLLFTPSTKTRTLLFSSPSLSLSLPPPPHLCLSQFLLSSTSLSSSLAAALGPQYPIPSSSFRHNRLQLLRCGDEFVLAFFPTGENSNQVGYVLLSVEGSKLEARANDEGDVFVAGNGKFNHPITRICVNPITDPVFDSSSCISDSIGYLMACTMYAVHWFCVKFKQCDLDEEGGPAVEYLGAKLFTAAVVHACWSPHVPEESVVLLESGEPFLFDLGSRSELGSSNKKFKGSRLTISWSRFDSSDKYVWLSCEFTWHPRILIVARSDAVFLVDSRSVKSQISCLAKAEMLHTTSLAEKDQFIAFSMAGSGGFCFVLASKHWLLLCDIRSPLIPVLQWAHGLSYPCFIDVRKLSELRAHSRDDLYRKASESGFSIILGSFWTCEFCVFCYGPALPAPKRSVASEVSNFCKSLYAWELPSDLALLGWGCPCGSCLIREELSKEALPERVDWQQKKEIVLGFGILDGDLSALLSKPDSFGGFTVIRLTSTAKLESQRYYASWEFAKDFEDSHIESPLQFKGGLLYTLGHGDYKFPKRYKYLKLDYCNAYLNGNLAKVLVSKMGKHFEDLCENDSFNRDLHVLICEKLKAFGSVPGSSSALSDVFRDISLPTSIREVASRKLWSDLPMALLQLAFSTYSEVLEVVMDKQEVSLEFLAVPEQPQLPPFFLRKPSCRSNKWSCKVQRGESLVGPVLPLQILLVFQVVRKYGSLYLAEEVDKFSPGREFMHQSDEVLAAAKEKAVSTLSPELHGDHVVSLDDDTEEPWDKSHRLKSYFLYNQVDKCSCDGSMLGNSVYSDERYATLISKLPEKLNVPNNGVRMGREELSDSLCPIALKFDSQALKPQPKRPTSFKLLKRQYSRWQQDFKLYQDFCSGSR